MSIHVFPIQFPVVISVSVLLLKHCPFFSIFGLPSYIHSDRGKSFISTELKSYLTSQGIDTSMTTPYHPCGNGQCECYNSTIWKAIISSCKSRKIYKTLGSNIARCVKFN